MIRVRGIDELLHGVGYGKAMEAQDNVSEELEDMAREITIKTARRAPVLTGDLRHFAEMGVSQVNAFEIDLNVGIYQNLPYFWRQNFEHKTKGLFFTTSFNEIQAVFGQRLQKAVDRTW